jgi:N-acetylglucosamine-6-phosphate deacetylase
MIITNAKIFNGKKFIKANTVEIENGIIKKIYYSKKFKKGININNSILCPGFIDIHTHSSTIDILDIKNKKDLIRFKNDFLKNGTTCFVLTTFYKKNNKKLKNIINNLSKMKSGAQYLGIYFEGPFINKEKKGAIPDEFVNNQIDIMNIIKEYKNIKIMTLAPEISNAKDIIKKMKLYNIIPSFGHSDADYFIANKSVKYGIKNVTHLFNAMHKWYEGSPPVYQAFLKNKKLFVEIIADGIHIPVKILKLIFKKFGKERIILISDKVNNRNLLLKNNKINSKFYLIDMVRNMKKLCHISIESVLQLATYNPSKLLNLYKTGMIKKGFYANCLVLNNKLYIEKTIFNGKIYL